MELSAKCPHPNCNFTGKQLQGLARHLNSTHKKNNPKYVDRSIIYAINLRMRTNRTTRKYMQKLQKNSCQRSGQTNRHLASLQYIRLQQLGHRLRKAPQSTLPQITDIMMEELSKDPLATVPKLTMNSSTWRCFGRTLQMALNLVAKQADVASGASASHKFSCDVAVCSSPKFFWTWAARDATA